MVETGLVICGTGADDGGAYIVWGTPSNITIPTEVASADAVLTYPGDVVSNYLLATNFSFPVPAGAAINGVEFQVRGKGDGTYGQDMSALLIVGGVIQTGWSDLGQAGAWPNTPQTRGYGGAAELWGASPALTRDIVVASNFGFALQVQAVDGDSTLNAYWVKGRIFYTPAGASAPRIILVN